MLSQSLSHRDVKKAHDDHLHHYSHNIFSLIWRPPRIAIPDGTLYMRGISAIDKIVHLHVSLYTICTKLYKLNICVWANLIIVYLHINQRVHFPRYQSTSSRNVVKYEQLKYCQTLFQNKNQSLVFQSSCLYSQHLPGTPLNAVHILEILKIYQNFPDGCVKLTGTNFFSLDINQFCRKISTLNHQNIFWRAKIRGKIQILNC